MWRRRPGAGRPIGRASPPATLLAAAAAALLLLAPPSSHAQDKLPTAVAAVIDYQRILRDAKAARSIRDQVEARRKLYQEEIARQEQRLHEIDKELARQRSVLTPEALSEKRRDFEAQVAEVQRMVQERRRQLDQGAALALNEVRSAMIDIVGQLSDVRGFNLVLPTSGVLLFSPRIDLTEEVLTRLDSKLPNVKVPDKVE
jgi:Skp family chaperone for outer membrane proteins